MWHCKPSCPIAWHLLNLKNLSLWYRWHLRNLSYIRYWYDIWEICMHCSSISYISHIIKNPLIMNMEYYTTLYIPSTVTIDRFNEHASSRYRDIASTVEAVTWVSRPIPIPAIEWVGLRTRAFTINGHSIVGHFMWVQIKMWSPCCIKKCNKGITWPHPLQLKSLHANSPHPLSIHFSPANFLSQSKEV